MSELRTDLPTLPMPLAAPAPAAAPAKKPLAFDQIRLRDGRVITVRENTAADDDDVDALLQRAGFELTGVGQPRYLRACAALAISFVNGQFQAPPDKMTPERLHDRLGEYKGRDMALILAKFLEVNYGSEPAADGEGKADTSEATFPA